VIFDSAGNLYGTTLQGGGPNCGGPGCGTVFKLAKSSSGWTETILHTFLGNNSDGINPEGNLIFDANGNLYGTTFGGGTSQDGTVFELSPTGSGWTETVVHSFSGVDGKNPSAGLTMGNDGNLYGTTTAGGSGTSTNGGGVVFELTHASGVWNQVVLYNFQGASVNFFPVGGLLFDSVGNLYGVTELGGNTSGLCSSNGCGTAFRLTPTSSGSWSQTVLYSLCSDSNCSDGMHPFGGLVFDSAGNLYGTAAQGGLAGCGGNGCGTVFEIQKDPSSTSLTLSANSIFSGASVTLTATVSGSGSTPTGSVTFNDGQTALGTGALNGSGVATLTTTSLVSPGAHSITAVYGGDTNYLGSTSSIETVTVNAATFTFSVSPASQTISNGTSASYTLTVTPNGSYTSQITFSCGFSPTSSAKCAANPVTPDANQTTTMLTVSGATPAASVQATNKRPENPLYFGFLTPLVFAGLFLFLASRQSKVRPFRLLPLVGVLLLFGCNGGPSKSTPQPPVTPPQKAQTYQITITATAPASATGSSAAITTAQVVSLTVNP
jgi:uncharacterized repeat protein (TIGR03803 family)